MAKRYDLITELYDRSIRKIMEEPGNWMEFLHFACRNYRLPFDEHILVHAQRPDAEKVLTMDGWRSKFGRWVKRDSKGIAVFDKQAETMRLKYYYITLSFVESAKNCLILCCILAKFSDFS